MGKKRLMYVRDKHCIINYESASLIGENRVNAVVCISWFLNTETDLSTSDTFLSRCEDTCFMPFGSCSGLIFHAPYVR